MGNISFFLWLSNIPSYIFLSQSSVDGNLGFHVLAIVNSAAGTPLQYSCLENPMDGGAWWAAVHGVAQSRTRLSDFTFTFHLHALEKEMATHSSILAWRIPGTGEPGGLPSMRSHRVRHDWSDLAAAWILGCMYLLNYRFWFFWIHTQKWDCWIICLFYF